MIVIDVLVAGGGPAGLSAALTAARAGAKVLICERDGWLGGQLSKQTHKFFGDSSQFAGIRGIEIAEKLTREVGECENIEVFLNATVQGVFRDGVIACEHNGVYEAIQAKTVIYATGASEKFLAFEGNHLPGVYGAGAVQTMMNLYGVKPASKVLMIGSGNIGLIVSYQLMQAGIEVAAIVEVSPRVGGYEVHAAKLRRAGVPIMTSHSIVRALGHEEVEGAVIAELDSNFKMIPDTERIVECDCICIAVGLQPLTDLCWQNKCKMMNVRELGGYVPVTDSSMRTSVANVFAAGDAAGVEEATAAILEGVVAGGEAAMTLGFTDNDTKECIEKAKSDLNKLRSGVTGAKIRQGLKKVRGEQGE